MCSSKTNKISIGITNEKFDPGIHICQIFTSDEERHHSLVDFIVSGLETGEKTACFTENESESSLSKHFKEGGIEFQKVCSDGKFNLAGTREVYFKDNKFNIEEMLELLKDFYVQAEQEGYHGARAIGEMTNEVEGIEEGSRLLEYESRVSILLRDYPLNTVCQYDAREFSGSTIMEILKVHPYMIVKGKVVTNPYYVTPEDYLASI